MALKVKELIGYLQTLKPDAEVCVVDKNQNNTYEIIDLRTCEDHSSEYYLNFLDIAIDLKED